MITKAKYLKFRALQIELKELKAKENAMRLDICDELLKRKRVGTHTFIVDDLVIKAIKKITVTPDVAKVNAHWDNMSAEEQACFNYKPSYVAKEYKKLDDTTIVDECLTTKPAMPSLEVRVPEE